MTQDLTEAVNAIRACIRDLDVEVAEIRLTEFSLRVELYRGLREIAFVLDDKELTLAGFDVVKDRLQVSAGALRGALGRGPEPARRVRHSDRVGASRSMPNLQEGNDNDDRS